MAKKYYQSHSVIDKLNVVITYCKIIQDIEKRAYRKCKNMVNY